jgi:hypothetical protein
MNSTNTNTVGGEWAVMTRRYPGSGAVWCRDANDEPLRFATEAEARATAEKYRDQMRNLPGGVHYFAVAL